MHLTKAVWGFHNQSDWPTDWTLHQCAVCANLVFLIPVWNLCCCVVLLLSCSRSLWQVAAPPPALFSLLCTSFMTGSEAGYQHLDFFSRGELYIDIDEDIKITWLRHCSLNLTSDTTLNHLQSFRLPSDGCVNNKWNDFGCVGSCVIHRKAFTVWQQISYHFCLLKRWVGWSLALNVLLLVLWEENVNFMGHSENGPVSFKTPASENVPRRTLYIVPYLVLFLRKWLCLPWTFPIPPGGFVLYIHHRVIHYLCF